MASVLAVLASMASVLAILASVLAIPPYPVPPYPIPGTHTPPIPRVPPTPCTTHHHAGRRRCTGWHHTHVATSCSPGFFRFEHEDTRQTVSWPYSDSRQKWQIKTAQQQDFVKMAVFTTFYMKNSQNGQFCHFLAKQWENGLLGLGYGYTKCQKCLNITVFSMKLLSKRRCFTRLLHFILQKHEKQSKWDKTVKTRPKYGDTSCHFSIF